MIIRCIDFETTGLAPPEAAVCEIGWTDVCALPVDKPGDAIQWAVSAPRSILVNPGHPIPPTTSAVHHIVDADVEGAPLFNDAIAPLLSDDVIFGAHNAKFERQFFAAKRWICSYKVALHLAPNAPEHKLQTLRYWLKLQVDRGLAEPPHRAGPDSYVCAHLIARMLAKISPQEMVDISGRASLLPKLHFGKHAGKQFSEVPSDYLDWLIGPKGIKDDEDVLFTARHHLKMRSAA